MKIKTLIYFILIGVIIYSCLSNSGNNKEIITIKGSDTMVNLTQKWVEEFMKLYPDISVHVTGGGSGTGVAALLNGTVDIANISRNLHEKEIQKATKLNITPIQHQVALDGIAVVVNKDNPLNTISLTDLGKIFSGKVTNWKSINGMDLPIVLYGRENSSGTYEFFKKFVLQRDNRGNQIEFSTSTQVLQGTSALGEAVAKDKRAIGYGGLGYFVNRDDLKILSIKIDNKTYSPVTSDEVNKKLIWSGEYPLSRYLHCYTNGETKGAIKKFIDFIKSDKGQEIVNQMMYIPLAK